MVDIGYTRCKHDIVFKTKRINIILPIYIQDCQDYIGTYRIIIIIIIYRHKACVYYIRTQLKGKYSVFNIYIHIIIAQ